MALKPRDEIIPREPAAEEGSSFSALRLAPEMLGGVGGGIVGGGFGLLLGLLLSPVVCSGDDESCFLATILLGVPIGAGAGLSIGAYGVGRLLGGQGGYFSTFLGMVVGSAVGTGIALLTSTEVGYISVGVGALGGAAVGFELSHSSSGSPPGARTQANAALSVLPIIGVTPQGGLQTGLMGRY